MPMSHKTDRAGLTITRADVLAAVARSFPAEDPASIMTVLDMYGTASYERERERVQLAILELSVGNVDQLLSVIQAAKVDYRDVLYWAEYGGDQSPGKI